MLNSFKNEDFERFLKGSADGLRMRPSDGVWKKINQRMNRRRRGVIISSTIFLLTASLFGYYLVDSAKSIHDPMATSNIIKDPVSTPFYKAQKENKTGSRITTRTTNNTTTQTSVAPSGPQAISNGLLPAIVAAMPFYQPLYPAGTLTRFEKGEDIFEPIPVDEYAPATSAETEPAAKGKEAILRDVYPQTIESVTNLYKRQFKSPKTEWQFMFTPTVSYRRLTENKSFLRQVPAGNTTFLNAMHNNVNNVVSHKPALGLELGMAFKYRVSNSIKLRSGLQLNISRYDIKAFNAYQPELATIALNNASGIDSINTLTRFRNLNNAVVGDWLENSYLQVSMPIGAEIKLLGNRNTHIGIATTVQPTYVLSDHAYLISADYKSYSQVPSLTRRWNMHAALETFVGYSTGKLNWQIGPQVRYQLLSSFHSEYPVKENLFDFGLKVGVSLNKQ